jgi:hypothetical protein
MKYSKYVSYFVGVNIGQDKVIFSANRIISVFITKFCGKEQQEDDLATGKERERKFYDVISTSL